MLHAADANSVLPSTGSDLTRAYATLLRGTDFLANGLRAPSGHALGSDPWPIRGRYRAKVICNALREVDRFLNLLADEAARLAGLPVSPGQRNTANKLRDLSMLHLSYRDYARLRALGRARECLFHCAGQITRGDGREISIMMTVNWLESKALETPFVHIALDDNLIVTVTDIADICAFYRLQASGLVEMATTAAVGHPANVGQCL